MAQRKTCVIALRGFTNINGALEQAQVGQKTMVMFPPSMKEMFDKCSREYKSLMSVPLTQVVPTAAEACDDLLICYLSESTLDDNYFGRYRQAFKAKGKPIQELQVAS